LGALVRKKIKNVVSAKSEGLPMEMPIGNFKRKLRRSTLSHFYLRREFSGTWKAGICLKINGRGERI
jgi:hypothetical protein